MRYESGALRSIHHIIQYLDTKDEGVTREQVLAEHGGDRVVVYDMIKQLEQSGDIARCGMGHKYRVLTPWGAS